MSIALYVYTLCCFFASGLAFLDLKGETDKMRRLAIAAALACVLSGVARAGEITSTGAVAPPAPSPVSVTGEIHPTGAIAPGEIHTTEETALTIILTLISLVP